MRPRKTIKISIPTPCHEDWNKMTPKQQGRHCASCNKIVRDFSKMSDQELIDFFQQDKGNTCGRFEVNQLNHRLTPTAPQPSVPMWPALLVAGSLSLAAPTVKGQEVEIIETPMEILVGEVDISLMEFASDSLRGQVMSMGTPLPNVCVTDKENQVQAWTDASGHFVMHYHQEGIEQVTLNFSHDDHYQVNKEVGINNDSLQIDLLPIKTIEVIHPAPITHIAGGITVEILEVEPAPWYKRVWWKTWWAVQFWKRR